MIGYLLKPAGKVRRERAPLRNVGAVACPSTVLSLHFECLEQAVRNDFRQHAPAVTWDTLGKPQVVNWAQNVILCLLKQDPVPTYVFNNV